MEDSTKKIDEEMQVVIFKIHNEDFCIDISKIAEIIKIPKYTKIPCSSDYIEGIINFRGVITAIIDLNIKLGFKKKQNDSETRIIIIEINETEAIGLKVDSVSEVIKIESSEINPTPAIITEKISNNCIKGIIVRGQILLIVIEADNILNLNELSTITNLVKNAKKNINQEKTNKEEIKNKEISIKEKSPNNKVTFNIPIKK
jgi:purine-binding chemotaxis protein CheW